MSSCCCFHANTLTGDGCFNASFQKLYILSFCERHFPMFQWNGYSPPRTRKILKQCKHEGAAHRPRQPRERLRPKWAAKDETATQPHVPMTCHCTTVGLPSRTRQGGGGSCWCNWKSHPGLCSGSPTNLQGRIRRRPSSLNYRSGDTPSRLYEGSDHRWWGDPLPCLQEQLPSARPEPPGPTALCLARQDGA